MFARTLFLEYHGGVEGTVVFLDSRARQRRWSDPAPVPGDYPRLHENSLLHALLYRRGVRSAQESAVFLGSAAAEPFDPSLLPNLGLAVERIVRAIERGETIGLYGDYDADGISSTALLATALRVAAGPRKVVTRLPTRAEGYGLNRLAIDELVSSGVSLLVALDCGSTDTAGVKYARSRGLDVIVVDHHHMTDEGPAEAVVISAYCRPGIPFRELSTAGLVYLLVTSLDGAGINVSNNQSAGVTQYLDLAAIGLVGDVSSVLGCNRALIQGGLERIRAHARPGIAALSAQAGVDTRRITASDIAFRLTPRLNAAGRMADPSIGLQLLLTDDPVEASNLSIRLEGLNTARKIATESVVVEAELLFRGEPGWQSRPIVFVRGDNWPHGILGIVAARMAETHNRPAVVFSTDGNIAKGSARSQDGFDMVGALANCADLIVASGGHSQAAGLTVRLANLPELRRQLETMASESGIEVNAEPSLQIDADLQPRHLNLETAGRVSALEPFGPDNQEPIFRVRDVPLRQYQAIGRDRRHLRLTCGNAGAIFRPVFFGGASRSRELVGVRRVDLAVTLSIGEWNGPQLDILVKDFHLPD
jgi:single-stranded-DNA-specific exonuclease